MTHSTIDPKDLIKEYTQQLELAVTDEEKIKLRKQIELVEDSVIIYRLVTPPRI